RQQRCLSNTRSMAPVPHRFRTALDGLDTTGQDMLLLTCCFLPAPLAEWRFDRPLPGDVEAVRRSSSLQLQGLRVFSHEAVKLLKLAVPQVFAEHRRERAKGNHGFVRIPLIKSLIHCRKTSSEAALTLAKTPFKFALKLLALLSHSATCSLTEKHDPF